MLSSKLNKQPVELLLRRHRAHKKPYIQPFKGLQLLIYPNVFNPAYTKVSGLLADNFSPNPGSHVLDMFCGSGALSLLAAQKAKKVIGVDISPTAIKCSIANAKKLELSEKAEFRLGNLWDCVNKNEKFDLIIANPPLLPATPENELEMAVADSPEMLTTINFLKGCLRKLNDGGKTLMSFSNACGIYFDNPLKFIEEKAREFGLKMRVKAELDVGYEVYRILEFS